jgi:hypothetical protein
MLIPLGFLAASGVSAGSFDLLETQVLGSSQASVTFSSLSTYASTYQHLQLRYLIRNDNGNPYSETFLRFNSDSGANYARHGLIGNGSSVASNGVADDISMLLLVGSAGNTATSNSFGAGVADILDPFETTKNKTVRNLAGRLVGGGEDRVALSSGLWRNTSAVSSITLDQVFGSNFMTGSRFSLYGIKAA